MNINSHELSPEDDSYYNKDVLLYPYKTRYGTKREVNLKRTDNLKIQVDILDNFTHIVYIFIYQNKNPLGIPTQGPLRHIFAQQHLQHHQPRPILERHQHQDAPRVRDRV